MSVEKVAEKMAEAFSKDFLWVCDQCGHVGDQGQKKNPREERHGVCTECGSRTTLKRVTVSGKRRRPHSLKRFEHRDEVERAGPVVLLESLPEGLDLGDRFIAELEHGGHPTLILPQAEGLAPLQAGHVYAIGEVDVYITRVHSDGSVEYTAQRSDQLVREDVPLANPEANPERKATHQQGSVDDRSEEEHPASPEAERLSHAEWARLERPRLEAKLAKVKEMEQRQDELASEAEADLGPSLAYRGRKQVETFTKKREAIEEDIRNLTRHRREKKAR